MMCHLDKTSCSRRILGTRGLRRRPETHFGVNAGFAAAAAQKRILDTGSMAAAAAAVAAAAGDEKKCHVECLGRWQ